ncbi:MAG: 16S rRNA (cytosine(1402)-N(4))-methyltransferase RsmH [Terrimicrobiaceae bacterium]|nr:16S rRNA (cytosine(1402)-N(4))-methyltransferase RsmH [Terrimicrobiaceae bacterium]
MNCLDFEDPLDLLLENSEPAPGCMDYHVPVLADEVVAFLRPAPGILFLDGTVGGGGHSERLLQAGARVIALDRDPEALAYAAGRLAPFAHRLTLLQANYADAAQALDSLGIADIGGALIDIGVSSHQLDTAARGFSLLHDGPLDMRMGADTTVTAADLVNEESPENLVRILREYGEENSAVRIVSHLVHLRSSMRFETTGQLADAVSDVIPRTGRRHPATRVFQALRIAVNDELGSLHRGLDAISGRLARGARFGVITFHSLEDRIVKRYFKHRSSEWLDRPEWPEPRRNPDRIFRLLTPHPIDPGPEEIEANPRARSAKLRIVEHIQP